ncbi:MAG: ACP S-malonyltransferase, partial [Candidatus Omnitrophota bacterium]|nr:ACP S-malonyltransferase [Candidatus Omnitrophota bacterium]
AAQMAFKFQNPAVTPVFTAGLSLGEYSALVSAGSLSIDNSLKLVSKRARFMKEASLKNPGKMLAIIGLSRQEVAEISGLSGAQIANLNSPAQIVVSGTNSQIEHAERLAREKGAKKAVVLKIEGPYHSRLMDEAAVLLEEELTKIEIKKPLVPVVANVTASCEETSEDIKSNLVKQLNHKTLWEDSIRLMISKGIKDFVEIGPGKVLKGILRRIDQDLTVYSIEKTADLDKLLNC